MVRSRQSIAKKERAGGAKAATKGSSLPSIPAAEALSFLRDTRGASTWTPRDMAEALKIGAAEAKQVIAVMEMQGYVSQFKGDEWMTTFAGETVSGSKPPRYTRERIEKALADLSTRMEEVNRDVTASYTITQAVAYGDFLGDRTRLQAAEVGVLLEERTPPKRIVDQAAKSKGRESGRAKREKLTPDVEPTAPTKKRETQKQFLAKLRGKGGILHISQYEDWMTARSHRDLIG
jgi:hypothetical protein